MKSYDGDDRTNPDVCLGRLMKRYGGDRVNQAMQNLGIVSVDELLNAPRDDSYHDGMQRGSGRKNGPFHTGKCGGKAPNPEHVYEANGKVAVLSRRVIQSYLHQYGMGSVGEDSGFLDNEIRMALGNADDRTGEQTVTGRDVKFTLIRVAGETGERRYRIVRISISTNQDSIVRLSRKDD